MTLGEITIEDDNHYHIATNPFIPKEVIMDALEAALEAARAEAGRTKVMIDGKELDKPVMETHESRVVMKQREPDDFCNVVEVQVHKFEKGDKVRVVVEKLR